MDYQVRTRRGGEVFYFNFALAREMGLLPQRHPDRMNRALAEKILQTFAIEVINEYDIAHGTEGPAKDIRPGTYMATRYLQLQHRDKMGRTSGDGRSIWNGMFSGRGKQWDISSCGTGTTCLSPAVANEGKLFKTGDANASYGSGRADLGDALAAALMSEVLHRNEIGTERTLALIAFGDGTSINVRAAPNLLRPAHLFSYLKQGDHAGLKAAVDYYIERQVGNGVWPAQPPQRRYKHLLQQVATDFARATARFESDYIFCWMEWDGDNILMDASILDYGSVRQFGLYHHEYRYDDVDRMSTSIPEQKSKAKYIVQTFAQLIDFVENGSKRPIADFRRHESLRLFEQVFLRHKHELFLDKLGFTAAQTQRLLADGSALALLSQLRRSVSYFERAKSAAGPYDIHDGITWDAIFCVRDILRELPGYHLHHAQPLADAQVLEIMFSNYAGDDDRRLTRGRCRQARLLQALYLQVVARAQEVLDVSRSRLLGQMVRRAVVVNRYDRITGDSMIYAADEMMQAWQAHTLTSNGVYATCRRFAACQSTRPEQPQPDRQHVLKQSTPAQRRVLNSMLRMVTEYRESV